MHEAAFYEKTPESSDVRCTLCGQRCRISPGAKGLCGVRVNRDGILTTEVYGRVAVAHVDPVEKKPLYHVHPGSKAMSVATVGCNLQCAFCQNWDLSQSAKGDDGRIIGRHVEPETLARMTTTQKCDVVAFTYSEPTIFYEWAYDAARLTAERGITNVFVTNGYMSAEPLRRIQPFLHGANVDLKAFRDDTYKDLIRATRGMKPVLDTLKLMKKLGIWVEVTTLVIPTVNDSPEELTDIASFIAGELGPETPWHVTRFHPDYQFHGVYATPADTLRHAREIGLEAGLRYVYVGNIVGEGGEDTVCHSCGTPLIERAGYTILSSVVTENGTCPSCGTPVAGIGIGRMTTEHT